MISFKTYISEATLSASGLNADYHTDKYIKPYVGQKDTHKIKGEYSGVDSSKPVSIHGYEVINGKYHAKVSQGGGKQVSIPYSKLHKPTVQNNKGFSFESSFSEHLKKHNLMPKDASTAGASGGTDFVIRNKIKNIDHKGRVTSIEQPHIRGELKADHTAAWGQVTIHHTKEKGWHIPESSRSKRPNYSDHVEKAGILDYLNKHHRSGLDSMEKTASGRTKNIIHKTNSLEPAVGYLKDHNVDVLHVGGGKGTYSVGDDKTGLGLSKIRGTGKFTVRQKHARSNIPSLTVQFQPDGVNGLEKSSFNLEHDHHVEHAKRIFGVHND